MAAGLASSRVILDESWAFKDATRQDTSYLTHGYHRYPAKFIPQLARRVISENTRPGDLVCDPFMGSGTTLVEALLAGRNAHGSDINPVAVLIAKAKTTPIEPSRLRSVAEPLLRSIEGNLPRADLPPLSEYSRERIGYWFAEKQRGDLAAILAAIKEISDSDVQTLLLCSFSNILKSCSRWLMKSVKPTVDKDKHPADARRAFVLNTRRLLKKNEEFYSASAHFRSARCTTEACDARRLSLSSGSAMLVLTSPPYVTSYEYADLHQLSALWLGYAGSLRDFRGRFIGSVQKRQGEPQQVYSSLARETVAKLQQRDARGAAGAQRYFFEMQQAFEEMHRMLARKGRAAVVIGNTDLRRVEIKNAEIFAQTMQEIGFAVHKIIKRPVPGKILPLTRDEKTGKFARSAAADRLAYPVEFIVIMEKR